MVLGSEVLVILQHFFTSEPKKSRLSLRERELKEAIVINPDTKGDDRGIGRVHIVKTTIVKTSRARNGILAHYRRKIRVSISVALKELIRIETRTNNKRNSAIDFGELARNTSRRLDSSIRATALNERKRILRNVADRTVNNRRKVVIRSNVVSSDRVRDMILFIDQSPLIMTKWLMAARKPTRIKNTVGTHGSVVNGNRGRWK